MKAAGRKAGKADPMESKKFIRILYLCIAVVMFLGMMLYSGYQEFWYDEVYQIGLVGKGLEPAGVLEEYMQLKDYTPPLFALIAYGWIRIVPFSFRYLLLIPELMTAAGVFVTALAGEKAGGEKMGLFAEIFASLSPVLILSGGYEFRSYALYFMSVAFVLYFLIVRIQEGGKRNTICFTISLIVLLYSHYYGSVIFGVLFAFELFFVIRKKQKIRMILPYFLSGLSFLPWLVLVFVNKTRSITEFWIQPPGLESLFELVDFLFSENPLFIAIFCLGLARCMVQVVYLVRQKRFQYSIHAAEVYVPGVLLGVTAAMFFYGAVINPAGGIFFKRYFLGLLPCCFILMGKGVAWLWEEPGRPLYRRRQSVAIFSLFAFLFIFLQNGNAFMEEIMREQKLSYTTSVKLLSRKEDIQAPDTVVVTSDNSHVRAGIEMYFQELFHKSGVHVISQHDEGALGKISTYKKIYFFHGKQPVTGETEKFLSRYEKTGENRKKRITTYVQCPE